MRVKVESIGGLTGEAVVVALYDTAELPDQEAASVRDAVESLTEALARGPAAEIGADLPGHRITVTGPGDAAPRVFEVRGAPAADLEAPLKILLGE
ncbi:hypothetical protein [Actinomadura rugatobispora]|uniref:Uncharacterized protein n=1 Tax=Actinomadura rugatobispora TaxID=1994 RepID=A0ABW0ZX94_9ACTN|nr:hypothetical protein GCM10010200_056060 [Actinomadura rugatobispora]